MPDQGVLAVITARGGSKGLPGKNIRLLGDIPLIAWTVRSALNAQCIDRVVVSTDDPEIAEIATAFGAEVPLMRPKRLALDTSTSVDVMSHMLGVIPDYQSAVLLQPTSPFRTADDLDAGFSVWQRTPEAGGCVSVCHASESPWLMYGADNLGQIKRLLPLPAAGTRRQDLPKALLLNGAFYFINVKRFWAEKRLVFDDSISFEMPISRSHDIDNLEDFQKAQHQISNWKGRLPSTS
jgi:CMP-N,N'-diacetyllegionaminic acid synthase